MEEIIKQALLSNLLYKDTKYLMNPTGWFVIGGPVADCGLTGRKIIVDSYGGMARHGGGCFSGKDPTKTDRSAAYMARYIAKNIVGVGNEQITKLITQHFDMRPGKIIKHLKLCTPCYQKTASYSHFGREDENFTWEQLDKVDKLR